MAGGVGVVGYAVHDAAGKDKGEKQEEDAGHFQPENAAHAAEGMQQAAYAAAYGFSRLV